MATASTMYKKSATSMEPDKGPAFSTLCGCVSQRFPFLLVPYKEKDGLILLQSSERGGANHLLLCGVTLCASITNKCFLFSRQANNKQSKCVLYRTTIYTVYLLSFIPLSVCPSSVSRFFRLFSTSPTRRATDEEGIPHM
jgi:hypothetical protein